MRTAALLLALTLAACSQTKGGQFCQVAKPILITEEERQTMSDGTINQLLAHNATWRQLCQ